MVDMWELDEASGNAVGAHAGIILTDVNTVGAGTCGGHAARDFERNNAAECFTTADSAPLGSDTAFTVVFEHANAHSHQVQSSQTSADDLDDSLRGAAIP
jgi:hypothetical protein